jgi:hypothetical protein
MSSRDYGAAARFAAPITASSEAVTMFAWHPTPNKPLPPSDDLHVGHGRGVGPLPEHVLVVVADLQIHLALPAQRVHEGGDGTIAPPLDCALDTGVRHCGPHDLARAGRPLPLPDWL